MKPDQASQARSAELGEIEEKLAGICVAMNKYGLPRRPDTRVYLREKIEILTGVALADPDLRSTEGNTARESLETFAGSYLRCDPIIATEIGEELDRLDPA